MITIHEYLQQSPTLIKVVVGYLVQDDKVLLGLRKKVSLGLGKNLISGIGGKLEGAESYEDALKREIQEEIGVAIKNYWHRGHVTFLFPHKPQWNQEGDIFVIDTWLGTPSETDVIKPMWIDKDKLPKGQMWEDNRIWIPTILSGQKIQGVFLYDNRNYLVKYTM